MITWPKVQRSLLPSLGIALLSLLIASLVRITLLAPLGNRVVWVTFYPAVVLGTLAGGWITGAFVAIGSSLLACYAWPLFADVPFIQVGADWLGLGAFLVNCAMIIAVAEAMRRARAQAEQARLLAEEANRTKSVFLANMSHELRTPLNAILGFSRLLQSEPHATGEQQRMLAIINRSGTQLLDLINSVLDVARIEAGKITRNETTIDLWRTLDEVIELLHHRAEERGLKLSLKLAPDVPRFIQTDVGKLRQALINLTANALNFSEHGLVAVRAAAGPVDPVGRCRLTIEVEDTGRGIALADQERIFEPFVRLGETAGRQGSGLGLTITRQFMELLGGTVRVRSELGRGSSFTLELPVLTVGAPTEGRPTEGSSALPHLAPGHGEIRVLIVEDQPENALLLQQILVRAGFTVQVAENGAVGLARFKEWRPDFIWMDWLMPVMDGLEAIRQIRACPGGRKVRIAVISASVFRQERDRVIAAGADDFVPKPLAFANIFSCMGRLLDVPLIAENPAAEFPAPSAWNPAVVAGLPASLLQEVEAALVSLEPGRIAGMIEQVKRESPATGEAMQDAVSRLQYSTVLRAVRAVPQAMPGRRAGS